MSPVLSAFAVSAPGASDALADEKESTGARHRGHLDPDKGAPTSQFQINVASIEHETASTLLPVLPPDQPVRADDVIIVRDVLAAKATIVRLQNGNAGQFVNRNVAGAVSLVSSVRQTCTGSRFDLVLLQACIYLHFEYDDIKNQPVTSCPEFFLT